MSKEKKTVELTDEELEKVSGGAKDIELVCSCGQKFYSQIEYNMHKQHCSGGGDKLSSSMGEFA